MPAVAAPTALLGRSIQSHTPHALSPDQPPASGTYTRTLSISSHRESPPTSLPRGQPTYFSISPDLTPINFFDNVQVTTPPPRPLSDSGHRFGSVSGPVRNNRTSSRYLLFAHRHNAFQSSREQCVANRCILSSPAIFDSLSPCPFDHWKDEAETKQRRETRSALPSQRSSFQHL